MQVESRCVNAKSVIVLIVDKLDKVVNRRKSCCLRIGPQNNASCLPVSLMRYLRIFII